MSVTLIERLGARRRRMLAGSPALQRFLRHRSGRFGLVVLALILLVVVVAPGLVAYTEDAFGATRLSRRLEPPGTEFWFGTDHLGRDVFSRVAIGGRISLSIGISTVVLSAFVGCVLGLLAGYAGGWVDELVMRVADIFLGIPSLVLAIVVALTLGGGVEMTVVAIAVTTWPLYARLVRGEVLRIKVLEYVEAAHSYGASAGRIVLRHVFPGTRPALITQAALLTGRAMLIAAALGFIGLGVRPPTPEWGLSIAEGREYLPESWWLSLFPGSALFLTVLALNFIGDALRVAFDPRAE